MSYISIWSERRFKVHTKELIRKINQSVEELDLVTTRLYIENNLDVVSDNKKYLKRNAREILNFLIEQKKSGVQPLSRQELAIIKAVNTYASQFDLSGIKLLLKEHPQLFIREDIVAYLNRDAKIILDGMKSSKKDN